MGQDQKLSFELNDTAYCCGLVEVGSFGRWGYTGPDNWSGRKQVLEWNNDIAHFATTTKDQKGAVKWLRENGFEELKTWKRLYGRHITLWLRAPKKKKRVRAKRSVRL